MCGKLLLAGLDAPNLEEYSEKSAHRGNVIKLRANREGRKEMVSLRDIFQISSPKGIPSLFTIHSSLFTNLMTLPIEGEFFRWTVEDADPYNGWVIIV